MVVAVSDIRPVAHLPLILGMLRKLEVAAVIDKLLPPHPDNVVSCGRGVEALVLAILDGSHALYKVGQRLEERGMVPLLQEGLRSESLHDDRLGQMLEALFAANLHRVFRALALKALEVYALPTPWIHQDTTTIALYGVYAVSPESGEEAAGEPEHPVAPRPAHGHSKDGRPDLKQVLLSLGVSGDGGGHCGWASAMARRVRARKPRSPLRNASRWDARESLASWPIAKPTVNAPWGSASRSRSAW
jgi:transposase